MLPNLPNAIYGKINKINNFTNKIKNPLELRLAFRAAAHSLGEVTALFELRSPERCCKASTTAKLRDSHVKRWSNREPLEHEFQ